MKVIILAGGFGTRLRSAIGDEIPKCMAPINGKPFVEYIIEDLISQGIEDITLSLHYKAEAVMQYFGNRVKYNIESSPLGTGGAIKNCISSNDDPVLVINGDTIAQISYVDMAFKRRCPLSIAIDENGVSAGIYSINPDIFNDITSESFSFENDVIPNIPFCTYQIQSFIDIGTPEGYEKAKSTLS